MCEESDGFLDVNAPLSFEHLFIPLVYDAREQLRQRVDAVVYGLLTPKGHASWERYLLTRLTTAGAEAALWQFRIFKSVRKLFDGGRAVRSGGADVLYRSFVGTDPTDRLQKLRHEFPALDEVFSVLKRNWLNALTEFLIRLEADRRDFARQFSCSGFALPIIQIEAGLGDPHQEGRCVVRMTFRGGVKLVYKPRSLAPEAHFSALLDRCNQSGIPHRLQSPLCWDRGRYGWMENIDPQPCSTTKDVHAFYWRAGALLGLVYLARGVDCHRGNLIAAGEFPVLVDLETLLHSQMPDSNQAMMEIDSVLRTGFLPVGHQQPDSHYQWSGLSWAEHATSRKATWVNINHDDMSVEVLSRDTNSQSHLPVLENKVHLAPKYVADIEMGFRWVGDALLRTKGSRTKLKDWLQNLAHCPRRLVIRPTIVYQAILRRMMRPETLCRAKDTAGRRNALMEMGDADLDEAETIDLLQMDVPYFPQAGFGANLPVEQTSLPHIETYLAQLTIINRSLRGDL